MMARYNCKTSGGTLVEVELAGLGLNGHDSAPGRTFFGVND